MPDTAPLRVALENVFGDPNVWLVMVLAALYGIFVGSIPGLTATMAVALLVPMTFFLSDTSAMAAIVTLVACTIFAGDIPGALVRIPGTPSSAAYTNDAYALTQRGLHYRALSVALTFSVAGGLFGAVFLVLVAPRLATLANEFSPYEDFWLYVLGLSCAAIVSHGSRLKGTLALIIGLLLAMVGQSQVHADARFTFENVPVIDAASEELFKGINFIPAMIGLFGLSEVLRNVLYPGGRAAAAADGAQRAGQPEDSESLLAAFAASLVMLVRKPLAALRSNLTGVLVGMLPGAGADIAAWISYAISKRFSRNPQEYGKGSFDGLAEATGANNSALAGAWIPALVLGIPGDSVTAIVIGVLMMKDVTPSPKIFTPDGQPVLVYTIYIAFFLANLILIPLGLLAIRVCSLLVNVPHRVLLPMILIFCVVGAFAIDGSYFDVYIMLAMGLLGFVLDRFSIPLGPVVLGMILGARLENAFIQTLIINEPLIDPRGRPIAAVLAAVCLLLWIAPLATRLMKQVRGLRL